MTDRAHKSSLPKLCVSAVAFALAACAHAPPLGGEPWYASLRTLAAEVGAARNTPNVREFEIVALPDAELVARYVELGREPNAIIARDLQRTLETFSLGTPMQQPTPAADAMVNAVLLEQLLAFYDFTAHRMYVREQLPAGLSGPKSAQQRTMILAHELGHVLQDQWGVAGHTPDRLDEGLAMRALLEGDASLTAVLVLGARSKWTPARAVERARLTLWELTPELTGSSAQLLSAPMVFRSLFQFPYFQGQRFLMDLYQAGGLELVRQALEHPPTRTASVFDAQRWLDGDGAHLVEPLAPARGRFGAALLEALVEHCATPRTKAQPALGEAIARLHERYEDDTFYRHGDALVWTTWWADLADSDDEHLPYALGTVTGCLVPRDTGASMRRVGNAYVIVLGGADAVARKALLDRVTVQRAPAAPAPFGAKKVPAVSRALAYRSPGEGEVVGGVWRHPRLGMSLRASGAGAELEAQGPSVALTSASGAVLFGAFFDEPSTEQGRDSAVSTVLISVLGEKFPGRFSSADRFTWTPLKAPWGAGQQARASIALPNGDVLHLQARAYELCDAEASFFVTALSDSPESDGDAERWLTDLTGTSSPPVCSEQQ